MTSFDIEIEQILCNFEGCKVGECDGGYCKKEMQKRVSLISILLSDRDRRVIERVVIDSTAIDEIIKEYEDNKKAIGFQNSQYRGNGFDLYINLDGNKSRILKLTDGNEKCEWRKGDSIYHETSCEASFTYKGNNYKYCPFCGREIVEKLPSGKD